MSRINEANCAFQNKKNIFVFKNIAIKARIDLLKVYVKSVAVYERETWITDETKLFCRHFIFGPIASSNDSDTWTKPKVIFNSNYKRYTP